MASLGYSKARAMSELERLGIGFGIVFVAGLIVVVQLLLGLKNRVLRVLPLSIGVTATVVVWGIDDELSVVGLVALSGYVGLLASVFGSLGLEFGVKVWGGHRRSNGKEDDSSR